MQGGGYGGPPGGQGGGYGGPPGGGQPPPPGGFGGGPPQQPPGGYGYPPQGYPQQQGYAPQGFPPAGMPQMPGQMQRGGPDFDGVWRSCPQCGSPATHKPSFTWWGGLLGPALFKHRVCSSCSLGYNERTGKSNATAIGIYFGVGIFFAIVVIVLRIAAG